MAMEGPHTRIVSIELHNHVAIGSHELHVPTLRVVRVRDGGPVPVPCPFVQDLHVVPV